MTRSRAILHNRFQLTAQLYGDGHSETWLGLDTSKDQLSEQKCIIRLWPFHADVSDESAKVLWSREERRIRRLAGTASAHDSLLTLLLSGREEPVGEAIWYLVMVLKSSSFGYSPLSAEVHRRSKWLEPAALRQADHRAPLWQGLRRIAAGIQLLHRQRILHRNVSLESIFWDPTLPDAPQSLRLGGFETSIRFGMEEAPGVVYSPNDQGFATHGATFPMDWFRLGCVLAAVFGGASVDLSASVQEQLATCQLALSKQGISRLTDRERELILRLLAYGDTARLVSGDAIVAEFDKVEESLRKDSAKLELGKPLTLAFNPTNAKLLSVCKAAGFDSNVDVNLPLGERDLEHQAELRVFLRRVLSDCRLYRIQDGDDGQQRCILACDSFCLLIASYTQANAPGMNNWDKAFVIGPAELRDQSQPTEDLRGIDIEPVSVSDAQKYDKGQSWRRVLPPLPTDRLLDNTAGGSKIHHFLRSTNLLELLLTSARIFPFERIGEIETSGKLQRIVIEERSRDYKLPRWTDVKDGLAGHLADEEGSQKDHSDLVLLTETGALPAGKVKDSDWWTIEEIGQPLTADPNQSRRITLRREIQSGKDQTPAPRRGYIRSFSLYGLFTLIERRKEAIDRMKDNTVLMRVMELADAETIQRTDEMMTPVNEAADRDLFDRFPTRKCFFEDVDRVRPLYVLQGPPGTGKSTFVAHQLRRILDKSREPYAQILVTAQAHAGVDVLRQKVAAAFDDLSISEQPIRIRLGEKSNDEDSSRNVSARIIRDSLRRISEVNGPDQLQQEWRAALMGAVAELDDQPIQLRKESDIISEQAPTGRLLRGMMRLLKRCASITYCTASAKDLAELAGTSDFDHTYDLVIVEEAGKIHAFDLVLPMSAGYSWLLIGDHKQLPAFQIDNFEAGLLGMDESVAALRSLPRSFYMDYDWLGTWEKWNDEGRRKQTEFSVNLLRYFKWLHESLAGRDGAGATSLNEALGTGAGRLSDQFRMPPAICSLISNAFYKEGSDKEEGGLTTGAYAAGDSVISLRFPHKELDVSNYPILWIDTPWCQRDERFGEAERIRVNHREARVVSSLLAGLRSTGNHDLDKLAVLTPYRRQVDCLRGMIGDALTPPPGFRFVPSVNSKRGEEKWVHTVHSFQGNEAHVVIASLVRNNPGSGGVDKALGFLADPELMNVLLSRPLRLLILVGSWDFFWAQLQIQKVDREHRNHELWFLRSVMDQLNQYFAAGIALKIPSTELTPISVS